MAKDQIMAVKDAVHKLQLCLLEGIQDENKLFAAGSLMSQGDYEDVVTERSIANLCGYPLCGNTLPSERPRKGRYRISLKEHKVYDLHETYMYCCTSCVVNSRAFAASLQEERSSTLNPVKLNEILRLFEGLSLEDPKGNFGKDSNLGSSKLKIQEKTDTATGEVSGEVSLEEWIGPSNAIEGYVPQKYSNSNIPHPKNLVQGHKSEHAQIRQKKDNFFSEMDFTSTLIIQEEYSISKSPDPTKSIGQRTDKQKGKVKHKDIKDQSTKSEGQVVSVGQKVEKKGKKSDKAQRRTVVNDNLGDLSNDMQEKLIISDSFSGPGQNDLNKNISEAASELQAEKASSSIDNVLKSSLKSTMGKRGTRSVTWADEKTDGNSSKSLCEFRESEDKKDTISRSKTAAMEVDEDSYRFTSAEACARALTEAAEAVASGDSDTSDAVAEAGIIVLPPPHEVYESEVLEEVVDSETNPLKWPMKPGLSNPDLFDSNDSWYDTSPEGFNFNLSPFATMFMALFAWISSSSLAYIYGHDENLHEDYLYINGREYPRKIFSTDGRSLEIKQALAGCLARALPGLVSDLRLPMPLSTLEKEMDHLLDTMSFMDPLPPFRMKQWQLLVLLFLDALSVCKIPSLTPYMTGRRVLPKVLEGAQISAEEYEIMKDLIIPLGRVPQFAMQSGA